MRSVLARWSVVLDPLASLLRARHLQYWQSCPPTPSSRDCPTIQPFFLLRPAFDSTFRASVQDFSKVWRSFTGRIKAHKHTIKEFQGRGRQYISRWGTCLAHVLVGVGTWSRCLSFSQEALHIRSQQFFFLWNCQQKKNTQALGGAFPWQLGNLSKKNLW